MLLAAITARSAIIIAIGIWIILASFVAYYGAGRHFPFWPLFISALFLGFPLVLLGIALAAGPDRDRA